MIDSERTQFAAALLSAAEMFDRSITDAAIGVYWLALKPLSLPDFEVALSKHLTDPDKGYRFPLPADLIRQHQAGRPAPWRVAWVEVTEAMSHEGAYQSVLFADGIINAVIQSMGGWVEMCRKDLGEPWTERSFQQRYEEFADSGEGHHRHLPGIFEHENRKNGYAIEPPVVIGDRKLLPEPEAVSKDAKRTIKALADALPQIDGPKKGKK